MKGISVVVCCYNSAKRLPPTLKHLALQKVDRSIPFEIILIDNASTDETIETANNLWTQYHAATPLKIIRELNPGLSHARRRGILEAQSDLVLFCDDDNWLEENYIGNAFKVMEENPGVGVLGGVGMPEFETDPPAWFAEFSKSYALGPQADHTGLINDTDLIYGAGMVVRRNVLLDVFNKGLKSMLSDRKGSDLVSGGDNEICLWYKFMGYGLYYSQDLKFRHVIPGDRLDVGYLLKRSYGKGKTESILRIYNDLLRRKPRIVWLENKAVWYYEIFKRLLFWFLLWINPFKNLKNRLKAQVILSAIGYRLRNYEYLRRCEQELRSVFGVRL